MKNRVGTVLWVVAFLAVIGDAVGKVGDLKRAVSDEVAPEEVAREVPELPLVRFGMPPNYMTSSTNCSSNWKRTGWDADILYTLATETDNLDGCVQVRRGEVLKNGTLTGGMLDLVLGKTDVYGKARTQESTMLKQVAYLYPHKQENVCLLIKRLGMERSVGLPPMPAVIWIVTVPSLVAFTALYRVLYGISPLLTLFEVFRTFITGLYHLDHRRLMVPLSFLSFFLLNLFSGFFVGSLVAPDLETEIDSLEEVLQVAEVLYTTSAASEALFSVRPSDDSTLYALVHKVKTIRTTDERRAAIAEAIAAPRAVIAATESILRAFVLFPEAHVHGISLFHRVHECMLAPAYDSFAVRRGWKQKNRFSALLQRMVEGGIVRRTFLENIEIERRLANGTWLAERQPALTFQSFSMLHLRMPFVLWAVGLAAAAAALAQEVLLRRGRRGNVAVSWTSARSVAVARKGGARLTRVLQPRGRERLAWSLPALGFMADAYLRGAK